MENTLDKKYQIFISSTYKDLVEARNKVRDAILSMMHFPVGMELFSAADEEQWEIIQETIDSSDYYLLIVGQRYGTVITSGDDAGISYTEKEFWYAKGKEIPILAFIISDDVEIKKANIETDLCKVQKLEQFKKSVASDRVVEWWKNTDELAQKVTAALYKQISRKKRPGWVRSDSFDLESSHAEILKLNSLVRELQEENLKLKSQVEKRTPKLEAVLSLEDSIENYDTLESNSTASSILGIDRNYIKLRLISSDTEYLRNRYEPLDRSCIDAHLDSFITNEAIEKYNSALPSKEEIDEYIEKMTVYQRIHTAFVAVCLQIYNNGTAKATDVRVSIDFPDEILTFSSKKIEKLEKPIAPSLPPNPIAKAEKEYERQMHPLPKFLDQLLNPGYTGRFPNAIDALNFDFTTPAVGNYGIFIGKSNVFIDSRQIPHKDLERYCGICLVPTSKGLFKARISLMCSEYLEEEYQYIDIEVV